MKIFRTAQIKSIDAATIKYEPIASIDLMERAAQRLTEAISGRFGGKGKLFAIFAGPGNNGGDGLAGRLWFERAKADHLGDWADVVEKTSGGKVKLL